MLGLRVTGELNLLTAPMLEDAVAAAFEHTGLPVISRSAEPAPDRHAAAMSWSSSSPTTAGGSPPRCTAAVSRRSAPFQDAVVDKTAAGTTVTMIFAR
ncbi:hypothetical protein ACIA5G_51735 [Amycolatopsis sp. NPDC051758]|uniref:hypothetical protein n=1 Tax=Amycolatopsis sp. NPDC051758 TaxID=3363935 RepID=UPI0037A7D331